MKHAGFDLPLELFEPEIEFPLSIFTLKECVSNRLQLFFRCKRVFFVPHRFFCLKHAFFSPHVFFPHRGLFFTSSFHISKKMCVSFQNLKDSANEPQSKIMSVKMKILAS